MSKRTGTPPLTNIPARAHLAAPRIRLPIALTPRAQLSRANTDLTGRATVRTTLHVAPEPPLPRTSSSGGSDQREWAQAATKTGRCARAPEAMNFARGASGRAFQGGADARAEAYAGSHPAGASAGRSEPARPAEAPSRSASGGDEREGGTHSVRRRRFRTERVGVADIKNKGQPCGIAEKPLASQKWPMWPFSPVPMDVDQKKSQPLDITEKPLASRGRCRHLKQGLSTKHHTGTVGQSHMVIQV